MKATKNLMARLSVEKWDAPMPIIATVGSLLGLVYIVTLPFVGLISLILVSGWYGQTELSYYRV